MPVSEGEQAWLGGQEQWAGQERHCTALAPAVRLAVACSLGLGASCLSLDPACSRRIGPRVDVNEQSLKAFKRLLSLEDSLRTARALFSRFRRGPGPCCSAR